MSTGKPSSLENSHLQYLKQALSEARKSPPKPTNFRVGCVIVSFESPSFPSILSTGYTLELDGNTHAEQCALSKLASHHNVPEPSLASVLSPTLNTTLYTTLEPCGKRLSGNTPCVQRIIATRKDNPEGGIRRVIFGAKEPGTFVQDSQSCRMLTEARVDWEYVPGLDDEILKVAMEGHESKQKKGEQKKEQPAEQSHPEQPRGTIVDDISPEERRRQEAQPRNPKKRMMEAPPGSG
jgi:pyrimidine deaminase RibD-like protein